MPGKLELAADLTRITFPYLLLISLCALLSGVLNSLGKFAAAAATPVLLNLVMMGGLLALHEYTATPAMRSRLPSRWRALSSLSG